MKPKVYFCRTITPEKVLELYKLIDKPLSGRVGVKVHSGETGNQNFLRPDFWKPLIDHVGGTVVECNTAYAGSRDTTEKHWKTIQEHGWSDSFPVDIMDAEKPDLVLSISPANAFTKTMSAVIWQIMIPCWCCLTLKDTRWVATAAH